VGAELFVWTDRETFMTKLIVACRSFANVPKNESTPYTVSGSGNSVWCWFI